MKGAIPTSLPGVPTRQVIRVTDPIEKRLQGFGKMLSLDCGHTQWEAGFDLFGQVRGPNQEVHRPCLSGCRIGAGRPSRW